MSTGSVKNMTRRSSLITSNGKPTNPTLKKYRDTDMVKGKVKIEKGLATVFIETPSDMDDDQQNEKTRNNNNLRQTPINDKHSLRTVIEQQGCIKGERHHSSVDIKVALPITSIIIPIVPQIKQQQQPIVTQKTEISSVSMRKNLSAASKAALDISYDIIPDEDDSVEEFRAQKNQASIVIDSPPVSQQILVIPAVTTSIDSLDTKIQDKSVTQRPEIRYPIKNTRKRKCRAAAEQQESTLDAQLNQEQASKKAKTEAHVEQKRVEENEEMKYASVDDYLEDQTIEIFGELTVAEIGTLISHEMQATWNNLSSKMNKTQMENTTQDDPQDMTPVQPTNNPNFSASSTKHEEQDDEGIHLDNSNAKALLVGKRSTQSLPTKPLGSPRENTGRKTEMMTPQIHIEKTKKSNTGAKGPYNKKSDTKTTLLIGIEQDNVKTLSQYLKRKSILDIRRTGQRINPDDLVVMDTLLGEGQVGRVSLAKYKGLLVACKYKRENTGSDLFNFQIYRELKFAAKLSICRYINRYIGWTYCRRQKVEEMTAKDYGVKKVYVIQRYISNCDARTYLDNREAIFQPIEVLQASICLFSALTDAHQLDIGIVDLKLENFLIDSAGSGWLTDFGSCIEFNRRKEVDLDKEEVSWTMNVAAPEMILSNRFSKASDVFMACLIIAELLTVDLSDEQFNDKVLNRHEESGSVDFSSLAIHNRYKAFFQVIKFGLANEPEKRPTASSILNYLLEMKKQA